MSELVERLRKREAFGLNEFDGQHGSFCAFVCLDELDSDCQEAADRIEALEAALRSIADKCPVTCDMTLAHQMAQEAEEALAALDKDAGK